MDRETEVSRKGRLEMGTYLGYGKQMGGWVVATISLALVLMQASRTLTDWWLAVWVSHLAADPENPKLEMYLSIYLALGVFNVLATVVRAFSFAYGGVVAARNVHSNLVTNVVSRASRAFLAANPVGRILNRFSDDTWAVDDSLPFTLNIFVANAVGLLGALGVVIAVVPLFGTVLVGVLVLYYALAYVYRKSSRELKRVLVVSRSPLYEHVDQIVKGALAIRSWGPHAVAQEKADLDRALRENVRAGYAELIAAQWLAVCVQSLGVLVVGSVALFAVDRYIPHASSVGEGGSTEHAVHSAGLVGLVLTYALPVSGLLNGLLNTGTETEKEFVSVERVFEYSRTEHPCTGEEGSGGVERVVTEDGSVCLTGVSAWYGDGDRDRGREVLSGIQVEIGGGESVLLKGRTGCGKSTLVNVIARGGVEGNDLMVDVTGPDGVLAGPDPSRIRVVTQDVVMFEGESVAFNLDPMSPPGDPRFPAVLASVGLQDVDPSVCVDSLGAAGRQRVALARVLLEDGEDGEGGRRVELVCLDEPGSSALEGSQHVARMAREALDPRVTLVVIAHDRAHIGGLALQPLGVGMMWDRVIDVSNL